MANEKQVLEMKNVNNEPVPELIKNDVPKSNGKCKMICLPQQNLMK